MIQDRAVVTMDRQQNILCSLSNGAIFNELERPLMQSSRARRYLTLNVSETVYHYSLLLQLSTMHSIKCCHFQ